MKACGKGEGVYLLQNLAAARALTKSTDQLIGDWMMMRGSGKTVCGLTLTNTEASTDNFAVYLKPRCDQAVVTFAPTMWRIERGELLLQSATGEIWRFEADDNAQWRRIPDSADPLILMRVGCPSSCFERVFFFQTRTGAHFARKCLDQPQRLHAGVAVFADNNVVVHRNAQRT